jgi:hypothetical protein
MIAQGMTATSGRHGEAGGPDGDESKCRQGMIAHGDARQQWLRKSGFSPILRGQESILDGRESHDPRITYDVVDGYLQVAEKGIFSEPAWVCLKLRFEPDHKKFLGVESRVSRFSPALIAGSDK